MSGSFEAPFAGGGIFGTMPSVRCPHCATPHCEPPTCCVCGEALEAPVDQDRLADLEPTQTGEGTGPEDQVSDLELEPGQAVGEVKVEPVAGLIPTAEASIQEERGGGASHEPGGPSLAYGAPARDPWRCFGCGVPNRWDAKACAGCGVPR